MIMVIIVRDVSGGSLKIDARVVPILSHSFRRDGHP